MTILERVVAADPAEFAAAHWGRAPLLSRAADLRGPDGFRELFSTAAVDELLSRRGLSSPLLRVTQDGETVPPERYTAGAEMLDEQVMRLFAGGATLVLQGLHRLWPPLIELAGQLGAELDRPLRVNANLTPPSQDFATHHDTHDVFVLQVEGVEHLTVHPPLGEGPPVLDTELHPGDALYLPRGLSHSVRTGNGRSLHLIVEIRGLTRYALVEELLAMAKADARLRASLPYRFDLTDPDAVGAELAATVATLRSWLLTADPESIAARLRERTWSEARPAPLSPLAQLDFAAALTPDDEVVARPGLRWEVTRDGDLMTLHLVGGRTLTMPVSCEPAVRLALDGRSRPAGKLPVDDGLALARRLLTEGALAPA